MDTFPLSTQRSSSVLVGECWTLVLVFGAQLALVGKRIAIPSRESITLGRGLEWLGPGGLDDPSLSRRHCTLQVQDDRLKITDPGSSNGTFINGERVHDAHLETGDLLRVGGLLFMVRRSPVARNIESHRELGCVSPELERIHAELRGWSGAEPLLLVGEVGVGKSHLARWLHEQRRPGSPLVELRSPSFGLETTSDDLFGEAGMPGLLESAHGGTLLIEGVDEAPPALQACLLGFLDTRITRRRGDSEARHIDLQVIATSRQDPEHCFDEQLWREDFGARLVSYTVTIPGLKRRPEDIASLALTLAALRTQEGALTRAMLARLLSQNYERNLFDLKASLARELNAAAGATGSAGSGAQSVGHAAAELDDAQRVRSPLVRIAADASWFVSEAGSLVALEHRKNLRLMLQGLLSQRAQRPGVALSADDVFTCGWPGERVISGAQNRVYVALSTLRKLGLRGVIERTRSGYLIPPGAFISIEPAGANRQGDA